MTSRQQWLLVLVVIVLLGGGAAAATQFLGDDLTSVAVGSDAPGFAVKTLDEPPQMKTLSNYRGDVLLLNLWATYCIPCRTEMPSIEALHKDFGPKGLKVVAVSIDEAGFEDQIREFAREYALTFEILYDDSGAMQSIFRTAGVPETYIIGRDGVIRKRAIGAEDWNSDANRALVAQLLADAKP